MIKRVHSIGHSIGADLLERLDVEVERGRLTKHQHEEAQAQVLQLIAQGRAWTSPPGLVWFVRSLYLLSVVLGFGLLTLAAPHGAPAGVLLSLTMLAYGLRGLWVVRPTHAPVYGKLH